MDFLSRIIENKRRRVDAAKRLVPIEDLRERSLTQTGSHRFRNVLSDPGKVNIIAEFKRRSPSKGIIRADAEPATIAQSYAAGGATAISVLTEEDFFDGSLDDLKAVTSSVSLPVLRKDFVFDEYQVYEAAASGADAVLLIVAALDNRLLRELRVLAEEELQIDALVEVHTKEEMERAVDTGARLIGVNNRNLATFEVTLETSFELARQAVAGAVLVSESGLRTRADLHRLREVGFSAFLIGESLMRSADPVAALKGLVE